LSQLCIEAVTQPTLNLKRKLQISQLYNAHHLSVAFSFTIAGLNTKKETKAI